MRECEREKEREVDCWCDIYQVRKGRKEDQSKECEEIHRPP